MRNNRGYYMLDPTSGGLTYARVPRLHCEEEEYEFVGGHAVALASPLPEHDRLVTRIQL